MTPPPKLFSFFLHILKPYKRYLAAMILVSFCSAIHLSLLPFVFKLLVDRINTYHGDDLFTVLKWPAITYVGLSLGIGLTYRFYDYILMSFIPQIKRDVQHEMFVYLQGHSHGYFQDQFAGSLANKVMDMTRGIPEIIQLVMNTFVDLFFAITIGLFTMSRVHWIFALALGIWAFIFLNSSWRIAKKCQPYATAFSESRSKTAGKIVDSISNMMNVRLFARNEFENQYLLGFTQEVIEKDIALQRVINLSRTGLHLINAIFISTVLFGLIGCKTKGLISTGDLILVLILTARMFEIARQSILQFVRLSQEIGTCDQALSIITKPHQVMDPPKAKHLQVNSGKIEIKNMDFAYQKPALFKHLNITIEAGTKVGLVGFSGSGKTTLVHLILRFFDCEAGEILIDHQNIAEVTQSSLHESIAMIPQDTTLFHRSLMDNIRYGRLEASEEEVIEASKQAHCHDFIENLPLGYQSLVGERGIKLSGGQRQRIAIARAILKNAPILILDEATSSLDSVTERAIQESLHTLMKEKTTLVIAHRLSTLSQMDRLLVFDKGQLIQDGHHDHLVKQPGHYQKLWAHQNHGFLPDSEDHFPLG